MRSRVLGGVLVSLTLMGAALPEAHAAMPVEESTSITTLQGQLVKNGKPRSGSYQVVAWPRPEVLGRLKPGAIVPIKVIGSGKVPPSGNFQAKVDPQALGSRYRTASGAVNIQVRTTDGQLEGDWNEPFGGVARFGAASSGDSSRRVFDVGSGSMRTGGIVSAAHGSSSTTQTMAVRTWHAKSWGQRDPHKPMQASVDICLTRAGRRFDNIRERIALVYGWGGASATVRFETGAVNSLVWP